MHFFNYLFFFQAEDGIRDVERSRGLGDVYKRQVRDIPKDGCKGDYLTIIPRVRMGYESIAHEAEGRMGY